LPQNATQSRGVFVFGPGFLKLAGMTRKAFFVEYFFCLVKKSTNYFKLSRIPLQESDYREYTFVNIFSREHQL